MAEKKETKKPAKKRASKSASKAKAAPKAKSAAAKGKAPTTPKPAAKSASATKGATKKSKAPAKKAPSAKKTPPAAAKKTSTAAKKTSPKPKPAAKKETKATAKKPEAKKKAPAKAKPAPKKAAAKPAAKKKAPAKAKPAPKKAAAKPAAKKTAAKRVPAKAPEQPTPESVREGRPGPRTTFPLFDRWDLSEIEVHDAGLARHINLSPTFLPHTGGRLASRPFAKARMNLVERLTNSMMRTEKYTGKKGKTIQVVKRAFETVEKRAKRHPVQVLVEALENAAPREEITRLRFGGISVPRAVDVAPARRLDVALRHLCRGAVSATYKNRRPIHQCLAEEILMAASGDVNSYAIGKKEEMERVAASAR